MSFSANFFRRRIESNLPPEPESLSEPVVLRTAPAEPNTSQAVDLADIWNIGDDREFLEEAYRRILRRPCDLSGFVNCTEMLRNHVPRRVVVLQLINSQEAGRTGATFTGIPDSPPGTRNMRNRVSLRALAARPLAIAQSLVRRLFYVPLESLAGRITLFMDAMASRLDRLTEKGDRNLWTLSEKIDQTALSIVAAKRETVDAVCSRQELIATSLDRLATGFGEISSVREAAAQGLAAMGESLEDLRAEFAAAARGLRTERTRGRRAQTVRDRLRAAEAIVLRTELRALRAAVNHASVTQARKNRLSRRNQRLVEAGIAATGRRIASLEEASNAGRRSLEEAIRAADLRLQRVLARDGIIFTEVDGFIAAVPQSDWRIAAYHKYRGVMEPGTTNLFRDLVRPGMTVIDVGANIGMYTLYACRLLEGRGRVFSFEPAPEIFHLLRENVQVNGFAESGIVTFHQAAVMDRAGVSQLAVIPGNCGHNSLFGTQDEHSVPVVVVTLDEILPEGTVADVVKIDAEGAEPFVLRGMRNLLERSPGMAVIVEFAPAHLERAGVDPGGFLDEIEAKGFEVREIDESSGNHSPVTREALLRRFSANLYLKRAGQPGGTPWANAL